MTYLHELIDRADLEYEIKNGYVKVNRHPTLPLNIYTYTRACQYEGRWNYVTKLCRGLVAGGPPSDDFTEFRELEVYARPFPKFFNVGEHGTRDYAPPLPQERFQILDKVDGSLGIVFHYHGQWIVASKGSFVSEQAQVAQRILDANLRYLEWLDPGTTYCCEILYPENRIVVKYDEADLVLLAGFAADGTEVPLSMMAEDWNCFGSVVRQWSIYDPEGLDTLSKLAALNTHPETGEAVDGTDAEGFVLVYESGLRAKIKFAEYIRLHRILTGVSERDIWRALAFDQLNATDGVTDEMMARALKTSVEEVQMMRAAPVSALATIVEGVPDEFDQWVKGVTKRLLDEYLELANRGINAYAAALEKMDPKRKGEPEAQRSVFANYLMGLGENDKTVRSCAFAMLDNKPIAPLVWRAIYPAASTPFKEDDE